MKSILLMIVDKKKPRLKDKFMNEFITFQDFFVAHNFQEVYELSLMREWAIVVINQGFEDFEEHTIISFLNQKDASTVMIPYQNHIIINIKKRIKRTLKVKEDPQ